MCPSIEGVEIVKNPLTSRDLPNNVSLQADNKPATPKLEFNNDGTRRAVALRIMNLRPDVSRKLTWEEREKLTKGNKRKLIASPLTGPESQPKERDKCLYKDG
ncbi:hypothetical protein E2C01_047643 [Portunus trituberculatus]|uniref:Uncharacterized protein n=1 Tax=Portunus trituberculatus TaxID=210409 RepID=A0A5B7GB32_PORTR|nr:hypothetical protein [Portunus trituberculatus]